MPLDSSPVMDNRIYTGQLTAVTSLISQVSLWLPDAQKELQTLKDLPENWDSYGSPKLTNEASKRAAGLLHELACFGMPKPDLFPVSGGGLQLEWQRENRELEIEVLPDGSIEYLKVFPDGKMEEGKAIAADVLTLAQWFRQSENTVMSV